MAKIAIRADGGKNIGLGHIMRSVSLAKELNKTNEILFICRESNNDILKYEAGIKKIKENGFKVVNINETSIIEEITKVQQEENVDCLITDSYDVDENYFDAIKNIFKCTGYIDDINICRLNVDFILNQNINAKDIKYNTEPNNNTKLFLGPQFCLLRDEFRKKQNKNVKEKVNDILITVGGMDKDFNTLKIVDLTKKHNKTLHVVIGGAFEDKLIKKLEISAGEFSNIKLYRNANMSELMMKCDLAISASGSTLYELCAMQVPTIGIVVAENQKDIGKTLNDMEVIVGTNDMVYKDLNKLDNIIRKAINDKEQRMQLIKNQKSLVNTKGVEILAKEINEIIDYL